MMPKMIPQTQAAATPVSTQDAANPAILQASATPAAGITPQPQPQPQPAPGTSHNAPSLRQAATTYLGGNKG